MSDFSQSGGGRYGGKAVALIDFVRIRIDDSMAAGVGQTITDYLGWTAESGLTRQQFLNQHVKSHLILTYQRAKRRENENAYVPPPDPDLQET